MTNKFKIQNGLKINSTEVLNSLGDFIGGRLLPVSTDSSTSSSTGAIVVSGGVGIANNLFVDGVVNNITFTKPTNAATLTLGNNTTVSFPKSLQFPSTNGYNNYVLSTNGAGTLNWVALTSSLPVASINALGAVQIGAGLEITSAGVLSTSAGSFGNIDGGGPASIYGGMPVVDGGGI